MSHFVQNNEFLNENDVLDLTTPINYSRFNGLIVPPPVQFSDRNSENRNKFDNFFESKKKPAYYDYLGANKYHTVSSKLLIKLGNKNEKAQIYIDDESKSQATNNENISSDSITESPKKSNLKRSTSLLSSFASETYPLKNKNELFKIVPEKIYRSSIRIKTLSPVAPVQKIARPTLVSQTPIKEEIPIQNEKQKTNEPNSINSEPLQSVAPVQKISIPRLISETSIKDKIPIEKEKQKTNEFNSINNNDKSPSVASVKKIAIPRLISETPIKEKISIEKEKQKTNEFNSINSEPLDFKNTPSVTRRVSITDSLRKYSRYRNRSPLKDDTFELKSESTYRPSFNEELLDNLLNMKPTETPTSQFSEPKGTFVTSIFEEPKNLGLTSVSEIKIDLESDEDFENDDFCGETIVGRIHNGSSGYRTDVDYLEEPISIQFSPQKPRTDDSVQKILNKTIENGIKISKCKVAQKDIFPSHSANKVPVNNEHTLSNEIKSKDNKDLQENSQDIDKSVKNRNPKIALLTKNNNSFDSISSDISSDSRPKDITSYELAADSPNQFMKSALKKPGNSVKEKGSQRTVRWKDRLELNKSIRNLFDQNIDSQNNQSVTNENESDFNYKNTKMDEIFLNQSDFEKEMIQRINRISELVNNFSNVDSRDSESDENSSKEDMNIETFYEKVHRDIDLLLLELDKTIEHVRLSASLMSYEPKNSLENLNINLEEKKSKLAEICRKFVNDSKNLISSSLVNIDFIKVYILDAMKSLSLLVRECLEIAYIHLFKLGKFEDTKQVLLQMLNLINTFRNTLNITYLAITKQLNNENMNLLMKQATYLANDISVLIKSLKNVF